MTYKELLEQLQDLDEEQLNMDVTVRVKGVAEFYGCYEDLKFTPDDEADVLDPNHPYIEI